MPSPSEVSCSPAKVTALANYLTFYPQYPLPLDLLADLILHKRLVLNQAGFGTVFSVGDIERGPWKRAFEDIANLGSLETTADYPPRQAEIALLEQTELHDLPESVLNLAFFALLSRNKAIPLVYRDGEARLFGSAGEVAGALEGTELPEPSSADQSASVLRWTLEVQVPRMFSRSPKGADETPGDDVAWLAPDELFLLLKEHNRDDDSAEAFRSFVRTLAAAPTPQAVRDAVGRARHGLGKAVSVQGWVFDVIDTVLLFLPPPFAAASMAVKKIMEPARRPQHRWLAMTDRLNARLIDRDDRKAD
jgi:hypothetical protein